MSICFTLKNDGEKKYTIIGNKCDNRISPVFDEVLLGWDEDNKEWVYAKARPCSDDQEYFCMLDTDTFMFYSFKEMV